MKEQSFNFVLLHNSHSVKLSGKSLLPYNVTPPRPAGPTEAERKIEELTRQLEEEMERNEEQGEYFGEHLILFSMNSHLKLVYSPSPRDLSNVRGEGDRSRTGVSGDGESVPHELLHLLLLWPSTAWKGVLQCAWKGVLRGGLHGEDCLVVKSNLVPLLTNSSLPCFSTRVSSKRPRSAPSVAI